MLQKYFSLQVNKQAGGSCENEQTDLGHFQPVGHLPDACSRFSAPLPCSPCLTAHADIDGNVNLCLSSQTSPSRVYRLAVAFNPKGISSARGLFIPSHHDGEEPLASRGRWQTAPCCHSAGGSTTQPVSATEAKPGHHEESFTCLLHLTEAPADSS